MIVNHYFLGGGTGPTPIDYTKTIFYKTSDGETVATNMSGITSNTYSGFIGKIEFADTVTAITSYAFYQCHNLTNIVIPTSVTVIDSWAFQETPIKSIKIPNNVATISAYAFFDCRLLEELHIPFSVTKIHHGNTLGANSLSSITVDSGNSVYDSRNNCNAIIETSTNTLIAGCKTTVIPDTVVTLGGTSFQSIDSITSITIPDNVTTIGGDAFSDCLNLNDINYTGTKSQWELITKSSDWNTRVPAEVVHCSDGDVEI